MDLFHELNDFERSHVLRPAAASLDLWNVSFQGVYGCSMLHQMLSWQCSRILPAMTIWLVLRPEVLLAEMHHGPPPPPPQTSFLDLP